MSQKSYDGKPTLYLVPTPIGNMEDITLRAIRVLNESEVIFSEDTRVTGLLLKHLEIKKKQISNYEHNEKDNLDLVLSYLKKGFNVSLVSDAGTPIISDPGYLITKHIIKNGYNVVALPGATAFIPALIASGLKPLPFMFYGFLNNKSSKRKKELEKLKDIDSTIIFYESSHRILETLNDIEEILGNRNISISREISKKYEQIYRGKIKDLKKEIKEIKGEFVIVIEYIKIDNNYNDISINDHVEKYLKDGYKLMDAIRIVSKERNIPKGNIYKEYHKEK